MGWISRLMGGSDSGADQAAASAQAKAEECDSSRTKRD
jgi:hypothetical protein